MAHANCSACHTTNSAGCAGTTLLLRLNYEDLHPTDGGTAAVTNLPAWVTSVNVPASIGSSTDGGTYKRIAPHDALGSAIPTVAGRRVGLQMPPIDSHVVDTVGVGQVTDWINALP